MNIFATAKACEEALLACAKHDAGVRAAHQRYGTPPFWQREPGFAALMQIILEQQVSLASAQAVHGRVLHSLRIDNLAEKQIANAVLALGADGLGQAGVTRPKQTALLSLAQACVNGSLDLASLKHAPDAQVMAELTAIKGIGPWTANVYLIFALKRADAWPEHDVAVMEAMKKLDNLSARPSSDEALERAKAWQPQRAAVARLLWHMRLVDTNRTM